MISLTIDSSKELMNILQRISNKNILVVGDLILDHYVEMRSKGLAREAAIPISKVINEYSFAGGAANLAMNLVALGNKVFVVGAIGEDHEGNILKDIMNKNNINTEWIVNIKDRCTTLHTRYYLDKALHLRIDREVTNDLSKSIIDKLSAKIREIILNNKIDCICVTDYDKGTITPRLLRAIISLANEYNIITFGQPMIRHYLDFIGFTAIKSNMSEASRATGISILNESSLHNLGINLLTRLSCKYLVLTHARGLTSFEENNIINIPSLVSSYELKRVIGIRDAMMAILALSLSSGSDLLHASILCNIAAAIAIPGAYTSILNKDEFEAYIDKIKGQLITKIPLHR